MRPYRGLPKEGPKQFFYGWYYKAEGRHFIMLDDTKQYVLRDAPDFASALFQSSVEVIPETVGQFTGLQNIYAGDYCVMDCWNGGDGIDEPNHHDIFEGIVVYDQKICRWGLQTKCCDKGQIEVGLEDSRFTTIEIISDIHSNPDLLKEDKE